MDWQFLNEVTMSCDKPTYCGSFSGTEFVKELYTFNAHKKETVSTPYELELINDKMESVIVNAIDWDKYNEITFYFDENSDYIVKLELEWRYYLSTDNEEIPWRGFGRATFAEYIYQKYVKKEIDLNNNQSKAYKVKIKSDTNSYENFSKEITESLSQIKDMTTTTNTINTNDYITATTTTASPTYTYTTNTGSYKDYNVIIDNGDLVVNGWNVGDYICNANPISNKENETKGEQKMNLFNLDFGLVKGDTVRISMYGIAIKNKEGHWVSFDPTDYSIIDVDTLNFGGSNYLYKIPVGVNDVLVGDVIVHAKVPMFVTAINSSDDGNVQSFKAIDPYAGEEKTILPTKNMFNFNFITKIISIMNNFDSFKPNENQPFGNILPLLMCGNDSDIDPMMLMMMLQQNTQNQIDPNILMMLTLSGKESKENLLPLILMMNMTKK